MKASILKGPSAKELSEKNFEFGLVTSGGGAMAREGGQNSRAVFLRGYVECAKWTYENQHLRAVYSVRNTVC